MQGRNNWLPQKTHMARRLERMQEGAELIHGNPQNPPTNLIRLQHKPYTQFQDPYSIPSSYQNQTHKHPNPSNPSNTQWQAPNQSSEYAHIDIHQTMKIRRGFQHSKNRESSYNKVRESYYKRKQREQKYDELIAPYIKFPNQPKPSMPFFPRRTEYLHSKDRSSYYPANAYAGRGHLKAESVIQPGIDYKNVDYRKSIDIAHQKYAELQKSRGKIRKNDFRPHIVESEFRLADDNHQRSRSSIMGRRRYQLGGIGKSFLNSKIYFILTKNKIIFIKIF